MYTKVVVLDDNYLITEDILKLIVDFEKNVKY